MRNPVLTALVVDDDEVDREGIRRQIACSTDGIVYAEADDGEMGLELLRSGCLQQPVLVVLDLSMPVMNGFEFLDALGRGSGEQDPVVIVFSTSGAERDVREAYRLGASAYVEKDGPEAHGRVVRLIRAYQEGVTLL